ncbi:energy-coupling factor transporter transmembrane protein EcfT [Clostridium sp. MSJ-8]|uniref:energy-coupling factor transporter transmembrane component T n=1 Tax=Clostridium sp. MSJ-8 TaxID=2841510 RepID=UPI001C0F2DDB|nr:energy-coupling factor transporter transmembrane component T [Clostridium sp. MSJ-8]MBU5487070.1 energy-coupling factor transporter transmembrane protein EcfT [Clostridium sp. MSJ-8]
MIKDSFSKMHPIINLIFFSMIIIFTGLFNKPIYMAISFISSFIFSVYLNRKGAIKYNLIFVIPLMIILSVLYPIWNHQGVTILVYVDYNPITLESIYYGISLGVRTASILMWITCYFNIMTSDKFMYIFGAISPKISLYFSILLRLCPRIKERFKEISTGQASIGRNYTQGNLFKMFINLIRIVSMTITWILENIIDVAASMKARGYGLKGRTSFSLYKFSKRDKTMLIIDIILIVVITLGSVFGYNSIRYYPSIKYKFNYVYEAISFVSYSIFAILPIVLDIREDYVWKKLQLKA